MAQWSSLAPTKGDQTPTPIGSAAVRQACQASLRAQQAETQLAAVTAERDSLARQVEELKPPELQASDTPSGDRFLVLHLPLVLFLSSTQSVTCACGQSVKQSDKKLYSAIADKGTADSPEAALQLLSACSLTHSIAHLLISVKQAISQHSMSMQTRAQQTAPSQHCSACKEEWTLCPAVSRLTDQSINQTNKQSINQSIAQSITQSIQQSFI